MQRYKCSLTVDFDMVCANDEKQENVDYKTARSELQNAINHINNNNFLFVKGMTELKREKE